MVKVAVGSTNPVKVKAVKNVFSKLYGKPRVEFLSVEVDSNVPSQPKNFQTIEGALNRAGQALKKTNSDFGVGIEAGLFQFPHTITGYVNIQWCVIVDKESRKTIGCSPGFELPVNVVKAIITEGKELEKVMEEVVGGNNLGEKEGAIGTLSKGFLSRLELTEQAVFMAMIPRLNEEKYF